LPRALEEEGPSLEQGILLEAVENPCPLPLRRVAGTEAAAVVGGGGGWESVAEESVVVVVVVVGYCTAVAGDVAVVVGEEGERGSGVAERLVGLRCLRGSRDGVREEEVLVVVVVVVVFATGRVVGVMVARTTRIVFENEEEEEEEEEVVDEK